NGQPALQRPLPPTGQLLHIASVQVPVALLQLPLFHFLQHLILVSHHITSPISTAHQPHSHLFPSLCPASGANHRQASAHPRAISTTATRPPSLPSLRLRLPSMGLGFRRQRQP